MTETESVQYLSIVVLKNGVDKGLLDAIFASGCAEQGFSVQSINVSGFPTEYGYFITQNS